MAIRLVHLYTGPDGQSHFSERTIDLRDGDPVGQMSPAETARTVSFEETASGSRLDWHNAPRRQYVITLSGTHRALRDLGSVSTRS